MAVKVTLSTVGYGDITPNNWQSQLVIMVMIICAVLVIPLQIGQLVDR